tara:strand:- start:742 stop:3531 length:2790 start_codon:yes stop_codon:yes gene_type:complete
MNVMNRPLFRAAGGETSKFPDLSGDGKVTQKDVLIGRGVIQKQEGGPIMPQEAAGQVQMASEAEGQQVGLDYVANTLGGIDQAEDIESMINAIRGNDMPIEARRTELAEFVGQDDAMATPEAVLAMVQPAIMLTEEGAMNSGIGDLMQGMTSDIDMATEGGQPTDMGQGVGQLMMAGAPMEEAPQQFAAGGGVQKPIQKFAAAGAVYDPFDPRASMGERFTSITEPRPLSALLGDDELMGRLFEESLRPTAVESAEDAAARYEALMTKAADLGGADEARKQQMALDLATAGFQFASGRDAQGRNIAGQPFLSQLGAAAAPFAQRQGERLAKQRETERAIKLAAIKEGIGTETRAKAAAEARQAQSRDSILAAAARREDQLFKGRLTKAQTLSAADTLKAQFGFNFFMQDDRQQFETENNEQLNRIKQEQMTLQEEFNTAARNQNEDIANRARLKMQQNAIELANLGFSQDMSKISQNFENSQDLARLGNELGIARDKAQGEINAALQESRLQVTRDQNEALNTYRNQLVDLDEQKFELQEQIEEDRQSRLPSTDATGMFGTGESEQERLNAIDEQYKVLRNEAMQQGLNIAAYDQQLNSYLNLRKDARAQNQALLANQQAVFDAAVSTQGGLPYGTSAEQQTILGDTDLIRQYAQGVVIPGFDQALTNVYGRQSLDVSGRPMATVNLPPSLRAALQARQEMGIAIPSLPGFAQGGPVEQQLPGGPYDPITGRLVMPGAGRSAMPTGAGAPTDQRSFPPRITQDIEDITLATGGREAIGSRFGTIANLAGNIIFGIEPGIARDTKQAQKAVETLSTIATTTLMAAIPGKDNVELQRMLKNLQVPAGEFALQDEEAFDYFKIARQTMDLGIENQTDLLQNANLNRREIAKVQEDLAQMNAIKAEYDNVIQAYENKLKPSEEVFDELDKFFK